MQAVGAAGVDGLGTRSAETKWIEFDPPDIRLFVALRERGFARYLAVVDSEHERATIARQCPEALRHVAVAPARRKVRENNADVLILSGQTGLAIWRQRNFRHAKYVAWRPTLGFAAAFIALACVVQLVLQRLAFPGV